MSGAQWELRCVRVGEGVPLDAARTAQQGLFRHADGGGVFVLQPPSVRRWTTGGGLVSATPAEWTVEHRPSGLELRAADPDAEVDLLIIDPPAAESLAADRSPPMTVIGSFEPVAGPATLARFLVAGAVLDTHEFAGRRCPSEQTALSLYRIARQRAGPFWSGVAGLVAGWAAGRAETAAERGPAHGVYGHDEVHQRFLVDGYLLLRAEFERTGEPRYERAADRMLAAVRLLSVPWGGGRWFLHDTLEQDDGRNDLVLNTHVHATLALIAAGAKPDDAMRALHAAVTLRGPSRRRFARAVALWCSDRAVASSPPATRARAASFAYRVQGAVAGARQRGPHLRLPGGYLGRDASGTANPPYLTVNLHDLTALQRNLTTPWLRRVVRTGLRYARTSGFFATQVRREEPLVVLLPILLRNGGLDRAARAMANRLATSGHPPGVGWPDHVDRLWARLAGGTP